MSTYAIDAAFAAISKVQGIMSAFEAGSDLAVFGSDRETVHLRVDSDFSPPEIHVENAATTSSGGATNWVKT